MLKKILVLLICIIVQNAVFAGGIQVNKEDGIYIFKIPLNQYGKLIKPYVADELTTSSDVFNNKELDFRLVVNGGFFDPKTGDPVSYVVINNEEVESLFSNLPLLEKLNKEKRAQAILNRAEFRILEDRNGNLHFDIENHFVPPAKGMEIKHSLQAGPMILPDLKIKEESFVKYQDKKVVNLAADVLKRRERTVLGIKSGIFGTDYLYILIFTKDHKIPLNDVREYCKKLGLNKAMAMDGGASTSINFEDIEIFSATDGQRRVRSFLVIEKEKNHE